MLFLLSPAKTLDESPAPSAAPPSTTPVFAADAERLAGLLAALPPASLRATLGSVSQPIAELNAQRYKAFASAAAKQAVFSFDGPAYKALNADELSSAQHDYVAPRLRVLCGLYGVLRPFDALKPYRLEMGSKLTAVPKAGAKTLYEFWGARIARQLALDVQALPPASRFVINCASQEYWAAVKPHVALLGCPVVTCVFATSATVYAKAARGAIVRFAAESNATSPEQLKGFTGTDGSWSFDAAASSELELVFRKGAAAVKEKTPRGAKRAKAA
jgi:cytoplasmic iron level regulating protein YaaA (DUF328/UPF0246 family)